MTAGLYATIGVRVREILAEAQRLGTGDPLPRNMLGEMLLADELRHELVPGKLGPDARDAVGRLYEYKVTNERVSGEHEGQVWFKFSEGRDPSRIERKYGGLAGVICAHRRQYVSAFDLILFVPPRAIAADLVAKQRGGGRAEASYPVSTLRRLGAVPIANASDLDAVLRAMP